MTDPIKADILESLDKAARKALGDRVLLTVKRSGTAFRPEWVALCASTKLVFPLGGREFSVHSVVFQSREDYLFIEGEYGLTFERAVEAYNARGVRK